MAKQASMSFGDPYNCVYDWPDDCRVQCGSKGIIVSRAEKSYTTAFFEAFPQDPKTFIRGEGLHIKDAEKDAWEKLKKYQECKHLEFEKQGYTNDLGFCVECGMSRSKAFEVDQFCENCNARTNWKRLAHGAWICRECANKLEKGTNKVETDLKKLKDQKYFQDYWERTKDVNNKKRREKYQTDPAYAEKSRTASKAYNGLRRAKELERRRAAGEPLVRKRGGPRKTILFTVGSKQLEVDTVRTVLKALDIPLWKFRYWRKVGILPDSPLIGINSYDRLYTKEMIQVIKTEIEKHSPTSKTATVISENILKGWGELGVL